MQLGLGVLPINSNTYIDRVTASPFLIIFVFYQNQVENEDHFLLVCPLYTDPRNRFLKQKGLHFSGRYILLCHHLPLCLTTSV